MSKKKELELKYKKEWKNWKARQRYYKKRYGAILPDLDIKKVKRPTEASIKRLKAMASEAVKHIKAVNRKRKSHGRPEKLDYKDLVMNELYSVIALNTPELPSTVAESWTYWKGNYIERFITERIGDIDFKKVYGRLNEFTNYCKKFIIESSQSPDTTHGKSDMIFRKLVKFLEECRNET